MVNGYRRISRSAGMGEGRSSFGFSRRGRCSSVDIDHLQELVLAAFVGEAEYCHLLA